MTTAILRSAGIFFLAYLIGAGLVGVGKPCCHNGFVDGRAQLAEVVALMP